MDRTMSESVRKPQLAWPAWTDALRSLLFGGNTLVRVGIVILFFGFAFFLNYAADQGWFPLEHPAVARVVCRRCQVDICSHPRGETWARNSGGDLEAGFPPGDDRIAELQRVPSK